MPATFSWFQAVSSSGGQATNAGGSGLTATSSNNSMSWDFETADNTGTQTYTANPVSAGSASYPVWLKGYWSNTAAFTVSNLKFWQFNPAASSANTASFTVFGTTQTKYSYQGGTSTGTALASNVQVPTSANSTASVASALGTDGSLGTFGSSAATTGINGMGSSTAVGSFLALQLSAAAAAPAGTTGYFGFTLQYDEQ